MAGPPGEPGAARPLDEDGRPPTRPVALLPWGNVIEDYLDAIGVGLDEFAARMGGGWMFGYVEALRRAGVGATIVCVSARATAPRRLVHAATGAALWVLPSPRRYRWLRRRMRDPYGWGLDPTFGLDGRGAGVRRPWLAALKLAAPYAATPLAALVRVLRAERCAAVLCQEYEYARFDVAVAVGRALRIPVFATFQGGRATPGWAEPAVRRWSVPRAAGLVIAPGAEAERVRARYRVPDGRIARIFNPVDAGDWAGGDRAGTRARLGIGPEAVVVVTHGRISLHAKGLDVLAAAWKAVCADRPGRDLRWLVVGTGDDAAAFAALVAGHELPGVVWVNEFVLERARMRDYLAAADAYVLASRREGFPVAPVEAMAAGLPAVAADAPGVADIFEDGERSGGIVVPREDADALADAIGRLVDDAALRASMGRAARRRIETRFALDATGAALRRFMAERGARLDGR